MDSRRCAGFGNTYKWSECDSKRHGFSCLLCGWRRLSCGWTPFFSSVLMAHLALRLTQEALRGPSFCGRQLFFTGSGWLELYRAAIIINCLHVHTRHMGSPWWKLEFYVYVVLSSAVTNSPPSSPSPAAVRSLFKGQKLPLSPDPCTIPHHVPGNSFIVSASSSSSRTRELFRSLDI